MNIGCRRRASQWDKRGTRRVRRLRSPAAEQQESIGETSMIQSAVKCLCCALRYDELPYRDKHDRALCSTCRFHQSTENNQTVKRHQEHEAMLRERLDKSSVWASEVAAENKKVKQDVYFAYRTRDRAANLLQKVNDLHQLRPDGSCLCKQRNCKTAEILEDRLAQTLIRNVDEAQEHVRRQRELSELALLDYDEDHMTRWAPASEGARLRRDDTG
jgi:hypothetical protein